MGSDEDMAVGFQPVLSSNGQRTAEPSGAVRAPRRKGSVEILCDEIGFTFDKRMERSDVLVAFVRELVVEIAGMRALDDRIAKLTGEDPSDGSAEALAVAEAMFEPVGDAERRERAGAVHDACRRLNPEDAYPTDHLIDMISSCASAIRFGLESPGASRHAASAANHVWKQLYGVRRFDSSTPSWEREWARGKLLSALVSMLPPAPAPPPQGVNATGAEAFPDNHLNEGD